MTPEAIRTYLRSKSDRELLSLYRVFGLGMIENPAVLRDGAVIPLQGYDVLKTGDYPNKVPVILGSNADELKIFLRFTTRIPWQSDLYKAASRYGTARWKVSGVDEVARRLVGNGISLPCTRTSSGGAPSMRREGARCPTSGAPSWARSIPWTFPFSSGMTPPLAFSRWSCSTGRTSRGERRCPRP